MSADSAAYLTEPCARGEAVGDVVGATEGADRVFDFAALDAATLHRDPFLYVVVPRFVRPEALDAAVRDFPAIRGPANFAPKKLDFGPGFRRVLDALASPPFADKIGSMLGIELVGRPTTITVRKYSEASDGNIHTDHPSKIVTVLLYFNPRWNDEGGAAAHASVGPGHRGLCRGGSAARRDDAGLPAKRALVPRTQAVRRRTTHGADELARLEPDGPVAPETGSAVHPRPEASGEPWSPLPLMTGSSDPVRRRT